MEEKESTILDVLSGNKAVEFKVSISNESIVILSISILIVIVLGSFISHKIKSST